MTTVRCACSHCGKTFHRLRGQVRSERSYCSRKCVGRSRRKHRSTKEKKQRKSEYDKEYRAKNLESIKRKNAEYFQRTKSPEKMKTQRQRRKSAGYDHAAYCREYYADPERKAHKQKYDRERRARLKYGEFWEAAIVAHKIKKAVIAVTPDKYERAKDRGYYNKAQQRRRDEGLERY